MNSTLNTSSRYIKLQVQYGSDIYELLLSSKDKPILVEHLLDEIEKLTKVPKYQQSLMYKGQRLDHTPKANLNDLYIFNNSKLILTGTQKSLSKSIPSERITNVKEEKSDIPIKSKGDGNNNSLIFSKKQDIHLNPIGFIPEPNKNYEYYTVPYRIDPTTLLQNLPTSNVQ